MKKMRVSSGIATNSMLLMFVQIVTSVMSIVVTKLLSVSFSLNEYGTYSQILLITSTATSISILGLTNATNYFYNKFENQTEQKKYVSTIFTIQYIVGILCCVLLLVFRKSIANYFGNDKLSEILLFSAWEPIFQNLIAMYQTLFVSIGEAKTIAVRNFVVSVIRLLAVFTACYVVKDIVFILLILLFMDIIQVGYFAFVFSKRKFAIRISDMRKELVSEILKFSIPMSLYVVSNSLTRDIDKYVIGAFSNTEDLAIYTNAAKVLPFDMLTTSLITVLIPVITRYIGSKNFNSAEKVFKLYLRIGYVLTFIFVGGAIANARYLMLFLYDPKYISGLNVFIIYLLIDMIRFANVTVVLSGAGKSQILMYISFITLALNAIFNVVSFKCMGIIGPALTTLLLTIVMIAALLHFGARELHTKVINLFYKREMLSIGIEIVIVGFISNRLSLFLHECGASEFVILLCSYGIYLIIMCLLNWKRVLKLLKELNQFK